MFNIPRKISFLLKSEMGFLYVSHALRTFASSMISIFIPIFLINLGFSLVDVAIFYFVQGLVIVFFVQHFIKYAAKKGAKKSMIVSTPIVLLFFLMLYLNEFLISFLGNYFFLILTSIVGIVSSAFYWMGLHIDFSKVHEEKSAAKQVSWFHALSVAFSILGPFIGATLIVLSGFKLTFLFVAFVFLLSLIPLKLTKDIQEPFKVNIKNIFSKNERKKYYPYFGEGFRNIVVDIQWPILLFLLAISISSIGGLYTLTNAFLAVMTIFIGKIITDKNKHKILNIGAFLHSVSLIARTLLKTVATIAAAQSLGAISLSMIRTPYESIHYNRSKREGIAQTVYAREIYLHLGKLLGISIFIIALYVLRNDINGLIFTIILATIATFLMSRIKD